MLLYRTRSALGKLHCGTRRSAQGPVWAGVSLACRLEGWILQFFRSPLREP